MSPVELFASAGEGPRSSRVLIRQSLLILVILLSTYSFTFSGIPRVEDEQLIAARAQSLVLWADLSFPQLSGNARIQHLALVDADQADIDIAVEPGQSVLASLFYRIGVGLDLGGAQAAMLMNLYLTALTGALVFLIVTVMGYRSLTGALCALAFGLGTMAWPYSKTLFRDGLLMGCTAIVMLGLALVIYRLGRTRTFGWGLMALGIVGGILTKRTAWVLVPALAIAIAASVQPGALNKHLRWRWVAVCLAATVAMTAILWLIPPQGPLARLSISHFVFAAETMLEGVGGAALLAFIGPFFSPGKSIFLASPLLMVVPVGLVLGWKQHRVVFIFALSATFLLAAAQALFYSEFWAGIPIWGLRTMLLTLPLLIVLCAPVFDAVVRSGSRRVRALFVLLALLSALIQFAGAMVLWTLPLIVWSRAGLDPYGPAWSWNLKSSPIPIQLSALFRGTGFDIAWVRLLGTEPRVVLIPIFAVLCVALAGILLFRSWQGSARVVWRRWLVIGLAIVTLIFPIYPNLNLLLDDPAAGGGQPGYDEGVAWTALEVSRADLVVVDSYGTPLWQHMLNHWRGEVRWYSLPYNFTGLDKSEVSLSGREFQYLVAQVMGTESGFGDIWVLTQGSHPDEMGRWDFPFDDLSKAAVQIIPFEGVTLVRLSLADRDK